MGAFRITDNNNRSAIKLTGFFIILISYILSLATINAYSAIGIEINNNARQIVSDHSIPKEILLIASELDNNIIPLSESLWINLKPFEEQANALAPGLRGTIMGGTLLGYDLKMKKRFSSLLNDITTPGQIREDTLIRLWIKPKQLTIYRNNNIIAVSQIKIKLHIEINSTDKNTIEILEATKKELEKELNISDSFQGLREILALFYCYNLIKDPHPKTSTIRLHYYAITHLTQAYLKEFLTANIIGGILLPKNLSQKTILQRPLLKYRKNVPSLPSIERASLKDYFITLSNGDNGILPYLLDEGSKITSKDSEELKLNEIIEIIEANNRIPLPEKMKKEVRNKAYIESVIKIVDYAIKHNFFVPDEIINLCQRLWRETKREKREIIIASLLNRKILLTPENREINLSRRKFLKMAIAATIILSLPNKGAISKMPLPLLLDTDTFLLLEADKQAEIIARMQSDPFAKLELAQLIAEISDRIVSGDFFYEDTNTRKNPAKILLTLIQSRTIMLLSLEAQTAMLENLLYLGMKGNTEVKLNRQIKSEILMLCSEVLHTPEHYPKDIVISCALLVVTNQNVFSSTLINQAKAIIVPKVLSEKDIPYLKVISSSIAEKLNSIHDEYERSNWRYRCEKFLNRIPVKLIYTTLALSEPKFYTATYNTIEDILLRHASSIGGLNHLIQQLDPKRILTAYFMTALSRRHYDLYSWVKKHLSQTDIFIKDFVMTSLKILARDRGIIYEFNAIKDVYITYALRRLLNHLTLTRRKPYLEKIRKIILENKLPTGQKYMLYFAFKDLIDINKNLKLLSEFEGIIRFLEFPPYPENNEINCLAIYHKSSAEYLKKMENLLRKYNFKETSAHKFTKQIDRTTITFTLELWRDADSDRFRKAIESGKYNIIFTHHHSYMGKHFSGAGSKNVAPQFIGTKGTGYGDQNNLLSIVLSEEIAKGLQEKLSWKQIKESLKKRISIDQFILPNSFLFKLVYIRAFFDNTNKEKIKYSAPSRVLIIDGGCGGINRIPTYIFHYKRAIYKLHTPYTKNNLTNKISNAIKKLKDGLAKGPIIISATLSIKELLKRQYKIDEILTPTDKNKSTHNNKKVGGLLFY